MIEKIKNLTFNIMIWASLTLFTVMVLMGAVDSIRVIITGLKKWF